MAFRSQAKDKITSLQPPQSIDAERAVLGAVLKNSEAINRVIEIIQDRRDFYTPKHQLIFKSVVDLYDRAEPVDITTVGDDLQKNGLLDKIGGSVYLVELVEQVASTANVAAYANIVLERGVLRR
ncbi:MAG: replicative DNA helicase, partial [bacterium]|nr:replicative DNA helicase [bacterium]